jgi:hypothetical protein
VTHETQVSTPRSFFEQIVVPDFDAYYADQGNIRLAFHVCMSLDHLADWIAKAQGMDRGEFLKCKYMECSDLKKIRDLSANAKHYPPSRTNTPVILMSVTAEPMSVLEWADVLAVPDVLAHGAGNQVKAIQDGHETWLLNPVSGAFHFWKREYDLQRW